ncbi:hypothetical protein Pla52n_67470 [Stieleria varia]|uniref:Uncharacterized protein n=1 Tax=Stieleria varia TaxID=2528005 RepID=A0A5C5ZQ65_9BACT|nr:hypothetical protein Pla52n_67470 [Stieleria varia]
MECGRPDARVICCHWNTCDGPASAFDFGHIVGGAKSGTKPGLELQSGRKRLYNPMVASRRYSAAWEDDRTMRWTEATHRPDEHGNHNGVARSYYPLLE